VLLHFFDIVLVIVGFSLALLTAPMVFELFLLSVGAALPKAKARTEATDFSPVRRLMVLVPSHNEEDSIQRCVASIAESAGGFADVLVIAHNCTDRTAERARLAGANVFVLDTPTLRGKGHALAAGFDMAFGQFGADAVLVIDADSTVSANVIPCVRQELSGCFVVQCRYEAASGMSGPNSRLRALAFLCMNVVRAKGRQRLGFSCGIYGNGFGFRKEVLEKVPYKALSVVEDLEFHLSLLGAGIKERFIEEARVFAEVPATRNGERIQSARWEGGRIRMLISHGPLLFDEVMKGKVWLLEPLIDLTVLPIGIGAVSLLLLYLFPFAALRWYASFGIATLAFHLVVGICLGSDPAADAKSLLQVPAYVASKIAMIPEILRTAQSGAEWVRTSRTK
jgi:cellulose synthase/poly-beta-1,6-N-acetylglucosamine synthase-like glycosyltransferase